MGRKSLSSPLMRRIRVQSGGYFLDISLDKSERIINKSIFKKFIKTLNHVNSNTLKIIRNTPNIEVQEVPSEIKEIRCSCLLMMLFDIPDLSRPIPDPDNPFESHVFTPQCMFDEINLE